MFKNFLLKTFLFTLLFFTFVLTIKSIYKIIFTTAPDFLVLWSAAKDLFMGTNPYTDSHLIYPYFLPPFNTVFYILCIFLSYKLAQGIFVILSLLATFSSVYFVFINIFRRGSWISFSLIISLTLLSFPTKFTFGMGQVNLISLFLLVLTYSFYIKERFLWAGIFLSVAIISKPVLGFLIIFFLFKRAWKVILYTLPLSIIALVIPILFGGLNIYLSWLERVVIPLLNFTGREVYYNQSLTGFIFRNISNLFLAKYLTLIFSIITLGTTLLFCIKRKVNTNLQFSLFIISLLLIDTLSWQHHFVWLIFPFIVLVNYASKLKKFWFWVMLITSYLLVSWNFKDPTYFSRFPISLVLSNTFYGTVILFGLNVYLLIKDVKQDINMCEKKHDRVGKTIRKYEV